MKTKMKNNADKMDVNINSLRADASVTPILLDFPIFTIPNTIQWLTIRPLKWDPMCPIFNYILIRWSQVVGRLLPATTAASLPLPPSCQRASVAPAYFLPACTERHSNLNFPTSGPRSWSSGPGLSSTPAARGPALHLYPENFPSPLVAAGGTGLRGDLREGRGTTE